MAVRSKASVCDCSLPRITGSTPAGDMDVSRECVFSGSGLCDGSISCPESPTDGVCLNVIGCNTYLLQMSRQKKSDK